MSLILPAPKVVRSVLERRNRPAPNFRPASDGAVYRHGWAAGNETLESPGGALYKSPCCQAWETMPDPIQSPERALFGDLRTMAQSLAQVLIHIIFATHHRHAWLKDEARDELVAPLQGSMFYSRLHPRGCTPGYFIAPFQGSIRWGSLVKMRPALFSPMHQHDHIDPPRRIE